MADENGLDEGLQRHVKAVLEAADNDTLHAETISRKQQESRRRWRFGVSLVLVATFTGIVSAALPSVDGQRFALAMAVVVFFAGVINIDRSRM